MADENPTPEVAPTAPDAPAEPDVLTAAAAAEAAPPPMPKGPAVKVFDRWDASEVAIRDVGLSRYLNLDPVYILHTDARHANLRFGKRRVHLVERLINQMMRTENWTGKKASAYRAVRGAFEIIEERAKDNPVQVLVRAIENAAPREEVTRLRYGGISVPKAVDVAPARRVDLAVRRMAAGAVAASHKSKTPIAQCIADEIIKASKNDMNSAAVAKKEEVERVAKSAR